VTPTPAPPWVVRVGRVGRTDVLVSASCLVVVALIAVAFAPRADALVPGIGPLALAAGAAVGVLVYAAALVHEAAHAAVARRHGHDVPTIVLAAAGGRTRVTGESAGPREEAATAFAGPVVSLAIGALALGARLLVDDGVLALVLEAVVLANLLIGLLDLVPTPPLDGGRLVRALAWHLTGSRARGSLAAAWTGRATAVVLVVVPVLIAAVSGSPAGLSGWAVCLGLGALAWLASSAELDFDRLRVRVEGLPVAGLARPVPVGAEVLLLTSLPSLPHDATADEVLVALVRRPDDHVLVDATGTPRGLLSLRDLEKMGPRA
jgi:Zn-dependent protease